MDFPALKTRAEVLGAPSERKYDLQTNQTLRVWLPSLCASGAKVEFPNTFREKIPLYPSLAPPQEPKRKRVL